ncbi:MAG: hypothetical protein JST16_09760 [Bdellovibrionales bacterium]|nr:hypothetical protein [Bdellovibrionales bacterium]
MAINTSIKRWLRHIVAPSLREMSRTGRIVQTLWDAAQVQAQQRDYYRRIGEIAIGLSREGKLQDIQIDRMVAKLDRSERVLKRQEHSLKTFQSRGDIKEIMTEVGQLDKDGLELPSSKSL